MCSRIAYYTCYFGGDINCSKLIPIVPSQTYDCYYFTNNIDIYNQLQYTKFIRVFLENIPIYNCFVKDTMATKELRSCPHKFPILQKYEIYAGLIQN